MNRLLAVIMVFMYSVTLVNAKGIFVIPGTKAGAMGGAFTGIADDLSAIYWNPAGLTQVEKGIESSAFYAAPIAKSNVGLGNSEGKGNDFPLPDIFLLSGSPGIEPGLYSNKELETTAVIPFIAIGKKVKNINLAAGFYGIGGGGGIWTDEVAGATFPTDTIEASIDSKYGFMVGNLSAAKEIVEKVSLGVGVNYIYMTDKADVEKTYTKSATSLVPAGYSVKYEQNASGGGIEFTAGLLVKAADKLKIGLSYRSGTTLTLDGTAEITTTGLAASLSPSTESDYEKTYDYPATYGFGISYQATDKLMIAAGADINNYSVLKNKIDYETNSTFLVDSDEDMEWDNTTQIRVGAEYQLNDELAIRAGLYTDPTPFDTDDTLTLINTNQYALNAISLGGSYKLTESLNADLVLGYGLSDKPSKGGKEYEFPVRSLRVGLGQKF